MRYYFVSYVNTNCRFGHTVYKDNYFNIGKVLDGLKEDQGGMPILLNWQEISEQQAHEFNDYVERFI